jgi:serine/threonine protein kinase
MDRDKAGVPWHKQLLGFAGNDPSQVLPLVRETVIAPPLSREIELLTQNPRDDRDDAVLTQKMCDHRATLAQVALTAHCALKSGLCHLSIQPKDVVVGPENTYLVNWEMACPLGPGEFVDTTVRFTPIGKVTEAPLWARHPFSGNFCSMPPEQSNFRAHLVGIRSDVCWLGASAFEIITGLPPFHDGQEQSLAKIVAIARTGQIPWERFPDLPLAVAVAEVLRSALAFDVYERYSTALAFREALLEAIAPFRSVVRM